MNNPKNAVKKEILHTANWEWLDNLESNAILGTQEISELLFQDLGFKKSVKNAYLNSLISCKNFATADGCLGRLRYWHKNTLVAFYEEIKEEIERQTIIIKSSINFAKNFEETRKAFVTRINAMSSVIQKTDFFKSEILPSLTDLLENAPTDELENAVITEFAQLWRLCRNR